MWGLVETTTVGREGETSTALFFIVGKNILNTKMA
jgi:hypothetical protein